MKIQDVVVGSRKKQHNIRVLIVDEMKMVVRRWCALRPATNERRD